MKLKNKFFLLTFFTISLASIDCNAGFNTSQTLLLSMTSVWIIKCLWVKNKIKLKSALSSWALTNLILFINSESFIFSNLTILIGNYLGIWLPTY